MEGKKYKVLLVEDDPDQIEMYQMQLETFDGFGFFCAKDYDSIVKIVKKDKPDIILLDLLLGAVKGEDILKKLNKENIAKGIPIVIFSNFKPIGEEERLKKMGARAYWPKTKYLPRQLHDIIIKMIETGK